MVDAVEQRMEPAQLLAPELIALTAIPCFLHLEAPEVHSAHCVNWPYASELESEHNKSSLMQRHAEAFFLKDFL